jgi:hypothetical protein
MIYQTLIVASLIGTSSVSGLLLSEAHGHVTQTTVTRDAILMSATTQTVSKVGSLKLVPAKTNDAPEPIPFLSEHITPAYSELTPVFSIRPIHRDGQGSDIQVAELPSARVGEVVTVTVTRRIKTPVAPETVSRHNLSVDAPVKRSQRYRLRNLMKNRQSLFSQQKQTIAQPEVLHGVYR